MIHLVCQNTGDSSSVRMHTRIPPPPALFRLLLQGRNVLVNLIPYNPTYAPGSEEFQEPTEEALQSFKAIVHEHGLLVTIRR